jgi:hypothetical protein
MILDISKYNDVRKNITTHTRGEDTVPSCFLYGFYGKHRHACMLSNERLLRGRWDQGRRSRGLRPCRRHGEPPGASCERGRAQAACTAGGLARARVGTARLRCRGHCARRGRAAGRRSRRPWPPGPRARITRRPHQGRPRRWEAVSGLRAAEAASRWSALAPPRPPGLGTARAWPPWPPLLVEPPAGEPGLGVARAWLRLGPEAAPAADRPPASRGWGPQ